MFMNKDNLKITLIMLHRWVIQFVIMLVLVIIFNGSISINGLLLSLVLPSIDSLSFYKEISKKK